MIHTFERRRVDPNRLHGVIVAESDSLILIQRVYDFDFVGYMVIRRKDVTKSYVQNSSAHLGKVMRAEGLWKKPAKSIQSLPLTDWKSLLKALSGKIVIIENERAGRFYIGPIITCADRSVSIHFFDASGKWQNIERIPYRSITSVQIDSRYAILHGRHLPPRPEKPVTRDRE